MKYYIKDNFIRFWFRFIYRYSSAVESGNFEYVKNIVRRDISAYSGKILEMFFSELISESGAYGTIGNYWETGNANEIDIVAADDLNKKLLFAEVKMNKSKFRLSDLKKKALRLQEIYKGYTFEYKCLSLSDVKDYT